ncbi:MAG: cell division protein FtsL [Bacillota bacterium]|nr:cell division protein FtsL [Bacillota bacterium]
MNDNLARVLEYDSYEEIKRNQQKRMREKQLAKKRNAAISFIVAALMFTSAFAVVSRYMTINELERKLSITQSSLDTLKSSNDQKKVNIDTCMSIQEIEEAARTRLGMNKPANNQTVYVSIPKDDTAVVSNN